jgi:hypothetical protein
MKILYLGSSESASTAYHRSQALCRLGHEVVLHNPYNALAAKLNNSLYGRLHFHTGYYFLQKSVFSWLISIIHNSSAIDLIWVDSGELFGSNTLLLLKTLDVPVVLFNHDDPTGVRDGKRFASLKKSLPMYDLVTAVRDETEKELLAVCKGKVLKIWRTYDEVAHSHAAIIKPLPEEYVSDICFIGTWMRNENRDQFLLELVNHGFNVAIWGGRWQKSPLWSQLKPYWRGNALTGSDYVSAIQGAKICLGLLSKGNRDLHTTRTMEIPYAGGLFCAERTSEHLQLYREDEEAVFWEDVNECADKCRNLLAYPEKREQIRLAGMSRVLKNKVGNEDICRQILGEVKL